MRGAVKQEILEVRGETQMQIAAMSLCDSMHMHISHNHMDSVCQTSSHHHPTYLKQQSNNFNAVNLSKRWGGFLTDKRIWRTQI